MKNARKPRKNSKIYFHWGRNGMCLFKFHRCIETIGNFSVSGQENVFGPSAITVKGRFVPFGWVLVYQRDPSLALGLYFRPN